VNRTPLIAGNWKMHTTQAEAIELASAIARRLPEWPDVLVCPPFPWLVPVADAIAGSGLLLGAQDCWTEPKGAYTGAVSPVMLAEMCTHVIIGHSERRTIFGESDELVARKVAAALHAGLQPIVCVGEDLGTRRSGDAIPFVRAQLEAWVSPLSPEALTDCVIAYEPVWAIGTGVAAEPGDAQEMALAIREFLTAVAGPDIASNVRILYGGSVTAGNAEAILAQPDLDGALVGGASLDADAFLAIVRSTPAARRPS